MRGVICAIALSGALAIPVLAQDGGMADPIMMTCAEFTALDSEGRMMAIEEMDLAAEEMATDMMMPEGMASDEMMSEGGAMMADDKMASDGSMMSEEMAADSVMIEGESMMAEGGMAAEGAMMAEDMIAAVLKACGGQPDKMVMDAMMEVPGN